MSKYSQRKVKQIMFTITEIQSTVPGVDYHPPLGELLHTSSDIFGLFHLMDLYGLGSYPEEKKFDSSPKIGVPTILIFSNEIARERTQAPLKSVTLKVIPETLGDLDQINYQIQLLNEYYQAKNNKQ